MKKMKLLTLVMFITTAGLFASELENTTNKKEEIRVQLLELLKTPNFELSSDFSIIITFTFNSEGELIVLDAGSKNRDVLKFIRKYINHKKFENPGKRDEIYKMPLKFKSKYKS